MAIVAAIGALACSGGAKPPAAPQPDTATTLHRFIRGAETTTVRMPGRSVRPATGPEALAGWKPDILPADSGGECTLLRVPTTNATIVTAQFPSLRETHTGLTLTFDSTGQLIRFSERRGGVQNVLMARSGTRAQIDSSLTQALDAKRATTISFDFAQDRGLAMNRGGGMPETAVQGSIREMENLENLGPPKARIARARRLCGV